MSRPFDPIKRNDNKNDNDVVIVSAVRTPLCRATKGALKDVPPTTLLSTVLTACIDRVNPATTTTKGTATNNHKLFKHDVQDICVGNVLSPASGAAAFRMAQLQAGFPYTCSLSTCNRQCSSGLQAVSHICNRIRANEITIGIGAGVESMSSHPMKDLPPPTVDWTLMQSHAGAMECLIPMGVTSDNVGKRYGLSREALDRFSVASHHKASRAQRQHKFDAEIVPVGTVQRDDGVRPTTTMERLAQLKPVFSKDGVTTAGNSSQMTDGAAAVLLMTRREANRRQLPILGIWRGMSVQGVPPHIMGIGPAVAIPAVLEQTGLTNSDIGVFEINEAFASQATWCMDHLGLDKSKVNPNGGAIALGHPLGCTGARQIATLLYELHRRKERYGIVSMCIGTGMGAAAVLEVEPQASM